MLHRRALLAAAGLALPTAAFAQTAGPIRFKPQRGDEVDAERGVFEVPEDRRNPNSRKIKLTYVRFRSTAAKPGHPIVYLAGGPGGTGSGTAQGARFPIFMALREVADVIAFDQRGTGLSNHIPRRPTPPGPPPVLTRDGLTAHIRSGVQTAFAEWEKAGVAMRGYNTNESADDIDDLRRHLGAEKIHLWGISYGSHLGLACLKRHGDRIDRVCLASLEGQDQTVKSPGQWDVYLRQVERLMHQDAEARAAVPDLLALMRRVHARLENDPVTVTLPWRGQPTPFKVGGFPMQMLAGSFSANPPTLAMLPGIYRQLDAGKFDMLPPYMGQLAGVLLVEGMPEAMDLASGISRTRLARIQREMKTAVVSDALNFPMPHLLRAVPGFDLGEDFRAPIRIPHRTLLVAGSLDGRTVLAEQAEVAAQFRDKAQVLVENSGHNVFEAHPQVQDLIVRHFKGERVSDTKLTIPPPKFRV